MYMCIKKCGINAYMHLRWEYKPAACPRCGGKIIKDSSCNVDEHQHTMLFHKRWTAKHMQVGLDKVYCPTRQSYLDACKHGRIMHAGTREISVRNIDPVGAKD